MNDWDKLKELDKDIFLTQINNLTLMQLIELSWKLFTEAAYCAGAGFSFSEYEDWQLSQVEKLIRDIVEEQGLD